MGQCLGAYKELKNPNKTRPISIQAPPMISNLSPPHDILPYDIATNLLINPVLFQKTYTLQHL